jgi:uncharacterized protein
MTQFVLATRQFASRFDPALAFLLMAFVLLWLTTPEQGERSVTFVVSALIGISPFLLLSISVAAYAKAAGADTLIARAFTGKPVTMIFFAALMGALSPFCSCGVIPLIAALLAMGVPLAPVMAFWLSSPLMDPSMFLLTLGTLGSTFAMYKVFAAVAMGLLGGFGTYLIVRTGGFAEPLRAGVGNGGCGASSVRQSRPIVWKFWQEPERREQFGRNGLDNLVFLGKWLTLAFFLESLMLAYMPAAVISQAIGGDDLGTIIVAALVGIPAYLNGYAALPLVGGLIEQGMAPGAGMAFMLAGGVSSIPAAIAVWALARPPVFAAYLGFAFIGSSALGLLYMLVV